MWVIAYMCLVLQRPKAGIGSPGTGLIGRCEQVGVSHHASPLQKQKLLLTNEPFIQFLLLFNWKGVSTFFHEGSRSKYCQLCGLY